MPPTVSETDVAHLAALLAQHGITLSPQLLAVRDNPPPAPNAAAVPNAAAAPDAAPVPDAAAVPAADVPPNAAAVAVPSNDGTAVSVEQIHLRCPHCNNTLVLDVQPAGSTGTGTMGKQWYAISVGREIGVFYGTWETEFKHLVSGVPHWFARRFSNEADARTHFQDMDRAGRTWVHVDN